MELAKLYETHFTRSETRYSKIETTVLTNELYDYLYANDYPAWLCNIAKGLYRYAGRQVLEWAMKLHTGETVSLATPDWTWEQREKLGHQYLHNLAEDLLNDLEKKIADGGFSNFYKSHYERELKNLLKNLELDGYMYKNSILLTPESDVFDVKEEEGVLKTIFASLGLSNQTTAFHHLELSEKHYIDGQWDDSISNSRKFLECVLEEVASRHSITINKVTLPSTIIGKPVEVRNYLEREGLLDSKEKKALAEVYGLLSAQGGHPYMAQNDQARLLRHLALTFCQFAMLRLDGKLKSKA